MGWILFNKLSNEVTIDFSTTLYYYHVKGSPGHQLLWFLQVHLLHMHSLYPTAPA